MMRLLFPFFAGVISWAFLLEMLAVSPEEMLIAFFVTTVLIVLVAVFGNYSRKPHLFGLQYFPILYLLGGLLTVSVSDQNFPDHLGKDGLPATRGTYLAKVVDQPKLKERSVELEAEISDAKGCEFGKVLIYAARDKQSEQLKYGEELVIRTSIQQVESLGNPNEFNYARYLRFHHIHYRAYVKEGDWKILSQGEPGIRGWFYHLRERMIGKLKQGGLSGNELSVASALILGYRSELDKDLMMAYAGSGATHVLAVSGLHVGIVYVILNWLLKFMDRRVSTRIVKTVLLIVLLASYAALTGLSASVFRAAVMFTFVAIGKAINRDTNIFNTLAASAFCLILYEPFIIMQVGFQLSYLAVIGIVLIQPRLFKLTSFNNRLGDWAWSITCVSIAAQITTFPLGLLYFHQFPNLFLLSNLLVIPAAAAILYLGFSLFVLSFWDSAVSLFGWLLHWLIYGLNWVVVQIEQIPYSVLSGIDISTLESLMIYTIIIAILIFILQKQRFGLYAALGLSVILAIMQIHETWQQQHQQFITLYNVKGETAIAFVSGTQVTFLARKELWENERKMLFHVRHHWWNKGVSEENFVELNDSIFNRKLEWGGIPFVVLSRIQEAEFVDNSKPNVNGLDFIVLNGPMFLKQLHELSSNSPIIVCATSAHYQRKMLDNQQSKEHCYFSSKGATTFEKKGPSLILDL